METVREQLVKRPESSSDSVKKYAILAGTVMLAAILIVFMQRFGIAFAFFTVLIDAGILWAGWNLSGMFNVEYEYCIAGKNLTVDKITDQRKRKTLCSFNLSDADGFYKSQKQINGASVINAQGYGEVYTIEFSDPGLGRTFLYFSPDERTLEMITPYLPRLS